MSLQSIRESQFERSSLLGLPSLVSALEGDLTKVTESCSFDLNKLHDPLCSMSFEDYDQILEAAAKHTKCHHFGLLLGQQADLNIIGSLGELTSNCQTVGDGIETFFRYYNMFSLGAVFRVSRGPHSLALIREPIIPKLALNVQVQDITLSEIVAIARVLVNPDWNPVSVHISHKPNNLSIYESVFGCPVYTGQHIQAINFAITDLDLPLNRSGHNLRQHLEPWVAQLSRQRAKPFEQLVLDAIVINLAKGVCSVNAIADELAMHPRTLHRKLLQQNGQSFKQLLEDCRKQLAHRLICKTKLSILEISESLAYSDPTAFSRSCRRWFNCSPTKLRKNTSINFL